MKGKHIAGVFGDGGGFKAVLPVLAFALSLGTKVTLYLAGPSKDLYETGKINLDGATIVTGPEEGDTIYDFFHGLNNDVLIIGASHSPAGVKVATNALIRWNHRVLCVEDMYGSAGEILKSAFSASIRTICVIDEVAREKIATKHPSTKDRIVVTGGPQFDVTADVKTSWELRRRTIRNALSVTDVHQVFLVAGGTNGTASILKLLEEGIAAVGLTNTARVILRQHPTRATEEDKRLVQEYLSGGSTLQLVDVDPSMKLSSDDLWPGVDYCLSGFSTTLHFGILYEGSGTIYVGTPEIIADHQREKECPRPPEVEAGAAWYVQDGKQMAHAIASVFFAKSVGDVHPDLQKIRIAQRNIADYNDGLATHRVWTEIVKLMTS